MTLNPLADLTPAMSSSKMMSSPANQISVDLRRAIQHKKFQVEEEKKNDGGTGDGQVTRSAKQRARRCRAYEGLLPSDRQLQGQDVQQSLNTDTKEGSSAQHGVRLGGGDAVTKDLSNHGDNSSRIDSRDSRLTGEVGEHQPGDPECDASQGDGEGPCELCGPKKSINVDDKSVMGTCTMTKAEKRCVRKSVDKILQQGSCAVDVLTVCEK